MCSSASNSSDCALGDALREYCCAVHYQVLALYGVEAVVVTLVNWPAQPFVQLPAHFGSEVVARLRTRAHLVAAHRACRGLTE
jgi:hypothetical protein